MAKHLPAILETLPPQTMLHSRSLHDTPPSMTVTPLLHDEEDAWIWCVNRRKAEMRRAGGFIVDMLTALLKFSIEAGNEEVGRGCCDLKRGFGYEVVRQSSIYQD